VEEGHKTEKKGPKVLKSGYPTLSPLSDRPHLLSYRNTKFEESETGPTPQVIHLPTPMAHGECGKITNG
jgi:hypothetical protein